MYASKMSKPKSMRRVMMHPKWYRCKTVLHKFEVKRTMIWQFVANLYGAMSNTQCLYEMNITTSTVREYTGVEVLHWLTSKKIIKPFLFVKY